MSVCFLRYTLAYKLSMHVRVHNLVSNKKSRAVRVHTYILKINDVPQYSSMRSPSADLNRDAHTIWTVKHHVRPKRFRK